MYNMNLEKSIQPKKSKKDWKVCWKGYGKSRCGEEPGLGQNMKVSYFIEFLLKRDK